MSSTRRSASSPASSRPTPRSTRATPAVRWPTPAPRSSASTPPSPRPRAAATASASPSRSRMAKDLMDQVTQAGGVDAPTVPDPGGSSCVNGLGIPGLDGLEDLPGLDGIPGLEDLQDLLPGLGLDGLLPELGPARLDQVLQRHAEPALPRPRRLLGEPGLRAGHSPRRGQEPATARAGRRARCRSSRCPSRRPGLRAAALDHPHRGERRAWSRARSSSCSRD